MTNGNDLAFPSEPNLVSHKGLDKREYFAAMAMQGLSAMENKGLEGFTKDEAISILANTSVQIADALIKALNEQL